MQKLASKHLKANELAEWPSNAEHLDALDRELALINCTKIWVDAATAGVTPRTAMKKNRDLLERHKSHSGNNNISAQNSPANSQPGSPRGASIFVYSIKQLKKLNHNDILRHKHIQQSCRNFALQIRGLKTALKKKLEALHQSVVEERPIPLDIEEHDTFLQLDASTYINNMTNSKHDQFGYKEEYDQKEERPEKEDKVMVQDKQHEQDEQQEEDKQQEDDEEENKESSENNDQYADDSYLIDTVFLERTDNSNKMYDSNPNTLIPDGWDINLPSPREHPFGKSRQRQESSIRYLPSLSNSLNSTTSHLPVVTISKHAPFGARSSGLLLRPSIISMDPSSRLIHIRKVLPSIVESISNTIVDQSIYETNNRRRLRPLPKLSSRACKTFSSSYDAIVTKNREEIATLATSQIGDIMHKLRKELNTVKLVQSSHGATWMMLIAFVNRHSHLSHRLMYFRAEDKLNRAAIKIQSAARTAKMRKIQEQTEPVRRLLTRNIWWFVLKLKCKMRRKSSKLVKKFVQDYVGGVGIKNIIYKYRWKIVRTQQTVRHFLACKHARMVALNLFWDREEKKTEAQNEFRAIRRSADAGSDGLGTMGDRIEGEGKEGTNDAHVGFKGRRSSAAIAQSEQDKKILERQAAFTLLKSDFHSRFLKTNSILLSAKTKIIGASVAAKELDQLGKWSKWRGGFARVCSREVMRVLLEPFLFKKRKLFVQLKKVKSEEVSEGLDKHDMMAFMKGESWEKLVERIKPKPVTWMLYTELRRNHEMMKLIEAGLIEQIKIDEAMEMKKLQLL
jgi:hypothetical protein